MTARFEPANLRTRSARLAQSDRIPPIMVRPEFIQKVPTYPANSARSQGSDDEDEEADPMEELGTQVSNFFIIFIK